MQPKDRRLVTERNLERHTDSALAPVKASVAQVNTVAHQALGSAQSANTTAGQANQKADNTITRVEHIETMAGLEPGEVTDAQTANLLLQSDSSTRAAFGNTLASEVTTPGSVGRAALDAVYERKIVIDANQHGVVADGVTDDAAAWQDIVDAAAPGSVITWTGRSMLYSPIIWKSNLSLVGHGWGESVLATISDDSVHRSRHGAIRFTESDGGSIHNTLDDCTFANFEVDGSELDNDGTYSIAAKGLFMLYMRRAQFLNLYIHDTQATGLGCDFLPDSLIHGVVAERCGYMNPGNVGGGAGIGIGTGAWEVENLIISNCTTRDNGNWGIFVEVQEYTDAYQNEGIRGTGVRIIGCTSVGDRVSFGDRGTIGTLIQGCFSHSPIVAGVSVSFGAREGAVLDNHVYNSAEDGIQIQADVTEEIVAGNHVYDSAVHGIRLKADATDNNNITVRDNYVSRSGGTGILVESFASSGGSNNGLIVRDNHAWNNGISGGAYSEGIRLDTHASGAMIVGNRTFDDQDTPTQRTGLRLSSSSVRVLADTLIEGNNLLGSEIPLNPSGHTLDNVTIRENPGYRTHNRGTATISDGTTQVTVPHGLGSTPTHVQLTPNGPDTVWTHAKGTGNIIIRRSGTSGTLEVDWTAEV